MEHVTASCLSSRTSRGGSRRLIRSSIRASSRFLSLRSGKMPLLLLALDRQANVTSRHPLRSASPAAADRAFFAARVLRGFSCRHSIAAARELILSELLLHHSITPRAV